MHTDTFDNVNYRILLKQHNGDESRARAAWHRILNLGGYGDVPFEYEGGLCVAGLRVLADERSQGQSLAVSYNMASEARGGTAYTRPMARPEPAGDLNDRIKQIEDIASGDRPK